MTHQKLLLFIRSSLYVTVIPSLWNFGALVNHVSCTQYTAAAAVDVAGLINAMVRSVVS